MIDADGTRQRIIPAEARGPWRRRRVRVHALLLLILVALPWIRINGLQALLIDLPNRRFEIFGVLFLSHDAPLLFFLAILAVLALVIVTAVWGRVWCGWACPQTVFIEAVYRRIEIWVEGDYITRRRLAARPMDREKFARGALKWFIYLVISSVIAHSVMAYFAGARHLLAMMQGPPSENWGYFVVASVLTALLMFDFGWFREQFCVIMCPYGRFQSVLMDQSTISVTYDRARGEPRRGVKSAAKAAGDCVSCNRCVEVCPTKIDIRDGAQMECIACTACIDACDEIMHKVKKPTGLIRHAALVAPAGPAPSARVARPRVWLYGLLMLFFLGLFVRALAERSDHSVLVLRAADSPFQVLADGRILNHFKIHYLNQSVQPREVEFTLAPEDEARGLKLTQAGMVYTVAPAGSVEPHVFVSVPASLFGAAGEVTFHIRVRDRQQAQEEKVPAKAIGPYSAGS